MLTAPRGRLTSDESLYVAEALNIRNGDGVTYTTGSVVTHRAPLYPAMLAADFAIAGISLDAGSWIPRLATVANAVLAALLARRLAGGLAGLVAGVTAASSSYLNGLGATLFLDQVEVTFVLASLFILAVARDRGEARLYAAAGACLGLAILVKESAIQLAPLPLVVMLLAGAPSGWRGSIIAWMFGLGATAGWWWVWVYLHSGSVYLLGDPAAPTNKVLLLALADAVMAALVLLVRGRDWLKARPGGLQQAAGLALTVVWGAAFVVGLESQGWEHPRRYLTDVPAYMADVVAPALPAAPLIGAAFIWAFARSLRGDWGASLVTSAALLFLPFVLVAANRELSLRDSAPFLYAGILALGCAAAWLVAWGSRLSRGQGTPSFTFAGLSVVLVALAAITVQGFGRIERAEATTYESDWDNIIARDTAQWLEDNVPAGTPLMSTRLYYSQVYFLADGQYPVQQLPTVLVQVDLRAETPVRARSTLFRWEELPERQRETWLYLTRYGAKGYYIAMAEEDLLADLRERRVQYLVLNTADLGFSSPSFVSYFDRHPAFTRVHDETYTIDDRTVIYKVDAARLRVSAAPLQVTFAAYQGLLSRAHGDEALVMRALSRLNGSGVEVVAR